MPTSKPSQRSLNDALRTSYLSAVSEFFASRGEEVLQIAGGEICIPVLDADRNDKFIQICVKVPTGGRDEKEDGGFDGYGLATQYKEKCEATAAKKAKKEAEAEAKARKIAERKASKEKKGE